MIPLGSSGASHVASNELSDVPLACTFQGGVPGAEERKNSLLCKHGECLMAHLSGVKREGGEGKCVIFFAFLP